MGGAEQKSDGCEVKTENRDGRRILCEGGADEENHSTCPSKHLPYSMNSISPVWANT